MMTYLPDTDEYKPIDTVPGLGESDDGVDQDVGLTVTRSPDSQLSVGAVHGISGLEGDNLGPPKLLKVSSELGGGVCIHN